MFFVDSTKILLTSSEDQIVADFLYNEFSLERISYFNLEVILVIFNRYFCLFIYKFIYLFIY